MTFYRLNGEVNEDFEFQNVIGIIATKITRNRNPDSTYNISFGIIQEKYSAITRVNYTSKSNQQELKLQKLFDPPGTIVFMNRCIKNDNCLDLSIDDEMAIVAIRPNVYQVEKFMKVSIHVVLWPVKIYYCVHQFFNSTNLFLKDPESNAFNINRNCSHIPKSVVGTPEAIKFPMNWPSATEEMKFIVKLIPDFFEYKRNLHRFGLLLVKIF